jgi:hypothetical protein
MSNNLKDEEKTSFIKIIFAIIYELFLLVFPIVKVFSLNSLLKRAKNIQIEDENKKWFRLQSLYNYFWGILFTLPFLIGIIWAKNKIEKDYRLFERIETVKQTEGVFNKIKKSYYVYYISESDSVEEKRRKVFTQTNVAAVGIILLFFTGIQFLFSAAFVHLHPILMDSKELRKYLIQNGILKTEDKDKIVLATPLGCMIDISGHSKFEVERLDNLWAVLDIKVKGSLEDKKKRTVVFFLKQYELKDKYIYDRIK